MVNSILSLNNLVTGGRRKTSRKTSRRKASRKASRRSRKGKKRTSKAKTSRRISKKGRSKKRSKKRSNKKRSTKRSYKKRSTSLMKFYRGGSYDEDNGYGVGMAAGHPDYLQSKNKWHSKQFINHLMLLHQNLSAPDIEIIKNLKETKGDVYMHDNGVTAVGIINAGGAQAVYSKKMYSWRLTDEKLYDYYRRLYIGLMIELKKAYNPATYPKGTTPHYLVESSIEGLDSNYGRIPTTHRNPKDPVVWWVPRIIYNTYVYIAAVDKAQGWVNDEINMSGIFKQLIKEMSHELNNTIAPDEKWLRNAYERVDGIKIYI